MKTTGGPEHSVAEPATIEQLDGDDIVVVPDSPHRHRRSREVLVGAVVVALIAAAVGIAIAATRSSSPSHVRVASPPASPPARTPPSAPHRAATKPAKPHPTAIAVPPVQVSPPPVAPTEPPVTAPPAEPTSVLQWSATPAAPTIKGGGHASFSVHVVNPTDGTVTLPQPLSCAPTLRGPKGGTIGFFVCEEMAQVLSPHSSATQRYTIYATDTAAAGGNALKPGNYTASVEHLFDVKVTVTA